MNIQITELQQSFINAYLEAISFTDMGPDDECYEADFSDDLIQRATIDCLYWISSNACYLYSENFKAPYKQAAHDLWLTRNGHGAGFWDRGDLYGPYADMFTTSSEAMRECSVYLGDDGLVYLS